MSTSTSLKATLQHDLTEAIRRRDTTVVGTLRMALAAVTTEEVAGKTQRELSDAEVLAVLGKEAKKRREASAAYTSASRPELAAIEEAELVVLQTYLPQRLTSEQIAELVTAASGETGATGMPQLGLVMKALQPKVGGRADGAEVAAAVRRALSVGWPDRSASADRRPVGESVSHPVAGRPAAPVARQCRSAPASAPDPWTRGP